IPFVIDTFHGIQSRSLSFPYSHHLYFFLVFFFSSRRRHTRCYRDWSSDVCSSDLPGAEPPPVPSFSPFSDLLRLYCLRAVLSMRSEERRVGKECRSRWSRDQ